MHLIEAAARIQPRHEIELRLDEAGRLPSDVAREKCLPARIVGRLRRVVEHQRAGDLPCISLHRHAQHLAATEITSLTAPAIDHQRATLSLNPGNEMVRVCDHTSRRGAAASSCSALIVRCLSGTYRTPRALLSRDVACAISCSSIFWSSTAPLRFVVRLKSR